MALGDDRVDAGAAAAAREAPPHAGTAPPAAPPRTLDDFLEACAAEASRRAAGDIGPDGPRSGGGGGPSAHHYYSYVRHSSHGEDQPVDLTNSSSSSGAATAAIMSSSSPMTTTTTTRYPWRYWLVFVALGVANSSDAAEILCLSYILSVDAFEARILHRTAWRAGLLAATVFLGMLLGGLLVGGLGDWWGRRPMLVLGLAANGVAGLLSAAAPDVFTLAFCRFVAGLGIGATVPPLFALCSELAPPASRGFYVTLVASFWMVGSMYVAIVGWAILGTVDETSNHDGGESSGSGQDNRWRIFTASCAVPSLVGGLLVAWCVPESPRFLLLQGRHDQALAVIHRLADSMQYTGGPPMTRAELVHHYPEETTFPIIFDDDDEEDANDGNHNNGRRSQSFSFDVNDLRPGTTHMPRPPAWEVAYNAVTQALHDFSISSSRLYTPSMRSTTFPLQLVWFSLSFGSYGLLTWINTLFEQVHLKNVYFNALLFSASNLPGNIMSAYLMDKTGRASLLTGSILAAALSLVAFAYVAAQQNLDGAGGGKPTVSASWIVVAACSFQCFTIASWNAIDVLTSELFPTSVRSTGMGVCAATGRVGAMLAQFVNGALVSHPVRLLLTAATALLLGSLTPALLPADQTGQPVLDYTADSTEGRAAAATAAGHNRRSSFGFTAITVHQAEFLASNNVEAQQRRRSSILSNCCKHRGQYERVRSLVVHKQDTKPVMR